MKITVTYRPPNVALHVERFMLGDCPARGTLILSERELDQLIADFNQQRWDYMERQQFVDPSMT